MKVKSAFQIFITLQASFHLGLSQDNIKGIECYSCSSIDRDQYESQYSFMFKISSRDACNDPFPELDSEKKGFAQRNRVLIEKIIQCSSTKFKKEDEQTSSDQVTYYYCFKFTGFVYSTGENVTARGCYRPPSNGLVKPDRDVYDSDNIYLDDPRFPKSIRVRGSLHLCDSSKCNNGHGPFLNSKLLLLLIFISIIHLFA